MEGREEERKEETLDEVNELGRQGRTGGKAEGIREVRRFD